MSNLIKSLLFHNHVWREEMKQLEIHVALFI